MPATRYNSHRISLAAMFTAFSLLFLFLSSILPTGRIAMYFLSSIFVMGILLEGQYAMAFISFLAVSLLGFFILPDKLRVVPYICFFGHYGIGKTFIENRVKDKIIAYILKLLYFNASMVLIYFFATSVLIADLNMKLPIWLLIVLAEVVFVVYDFLYSLVTTFYYRRVRKFLIRD